MCAGHAATSGVYGGTVVGRRCGSQPHGLGRSTDVAGWRVPEAGVGGVVWGRWELSPMTGSWVWRMLDGQGVSAHPPVRKPLRDRYPVMRLIQENDEHREREPEQLLT